jgi:hypothetical protein
MRLLALIALACLAFSPADARPRQALQCVSDNLGREVCAGTAGRIQSHASASGEGVIGRRPAGCPRRFCGCEASLYLFGKIDPYLNLAANWVRKFPRAHPAPGMAAARPGHVMVLLAHAGGDDWMVRDGNSGGGYTREHVRSIRGFKIVDPNGNRVAPND